MATVDRQLGSRFRSDRERESGNEGSNAGTWAMCFECEAARWKTRSAQSAECRCGKKNGENRRRTCRLATCWCGSRRFMSIRSGRWAWISALKPMPLRHEAARRRSTGKQTKHGFKNLLHTRRAAETELCWSVADNVAADSSECNHQRRQLDPPPNTDTRLCVSWTSTVRSPEKSVRTGKVLNVDVGIAGRPPLRPQEQRVFGRFLLRALVLFVLSSPKRVIENKSSK